MRGRRALLAAVAAAALAAGVAAAALFGDGDTPEPPRASEAGEAPRARNVLSVVPVDEEVPPAVAADATYVLGDDLHRQGTPEPERLAHRLQAPLLGQSAAVAVPSRDGRWLAYHAWREETPLLVVRELRTGQERVLARGAQSVAWGPDGQIAYFQADQPKRGDGPYVGHVVVRATVDAPPRRWTRASDAYEVRAWAGARLLVAVRYCPGCSADGLDPALYALDGPGEPTLLPLADLSALSPDGRLAVGPWAEVRGQDSPTPFARLVEVATGRVQHTLDVPQAVRATGVDVAAGAGGFFEASWRGDEILAHAVAVPDAMLVLLRVEEERLVLEDVLRPDADAFGARHGVALGRPSFTGTGADRFVVSAAWEVESGGFGVSVLSCTRSTRSCVSGKPRSGAAWFALVESPSRP